MWVKALCYGIFEQFAITRGNAKMSQMDMGNNPMVGATVACAVAVEEAMKG